MAEQRKPMTMSGFCHNPTIINAVETSHEYCTYERCTCWCHREEKS
jgi:hypothetical protein